MMGEYVPFDAGLAKEHMLSVIISAFQEGDEVRKTVASVLALKEEVGDLQIIVGDDGSPDGCCDGMPSEVHVHRMGRHAGRGITANECAALADGDALLFADAHMRVPPGTLRDTLSTLVQHNAVTCAGVQGMEKDHGSQGFGAEFRFHRNGRLGTRFYHPPKPWPAHHAAMVDEPFGGFYGFSRSAWERLGGWTDCAAVWGYCEQPIGFMCWALGIPILAVNHVIGHLFRKVNPCGATAESVWENVCYGHAIAFHPLTFDHYWKPILVNHLGLDRVLEIEGRPIVRNRHNNFACQVSDGKTDAAFFREILKVPVVEGNGGSVKAVKTSSIVLPSFNEGEEPRHTVRSIMRSTRTDPEIILVDDASTDKSCERKQGNRIIFPKTTRILRNPTRQGVTRSRLVGIKASRENVLGFMDSHSRIREGDVDRLTEAALETGGFIVAAMRGMGEIRTVKGGDPRANWGSRWCVKAKWGLRGAYNVTKPEHTLAGNVSRCNMLMGSCYWTRRDVLERLGGWPALPGKWAYSEQAMALKCWHLKIPIFVHCGVLVDHKMKKGEIDVPQEDVILNAHFVHRAYFEEWTYENIWRPILAEMGDSPKIAELLQSKLLRDEIAWMDKHRRYSDERFFRALTPEDNMLTNLKAGRSVPKTLAGYVAYQARRSPGREWYADRQRMEQRHIPELIKILGKGNPREDLTLLDVGSRDGYIFEVLTHNGFTVGKVRGIEMSPWAVANATEHGRPVRWFDAHRLAEWPEAGRDIVTIIHCLEHCHQPTAVLAGALSVLKPGGLLMVTVPLEAKGLSVKGDHCYAMRSPAHVQKLISDAGFLLMVGSESQVGTEYTIFARKGE